MVLPTLIEVYPSAGEALEFPYAPAARFLAPGGSLKAFVEPGRDG